MKILRLKKWEKPTQKKIYEIIDSLCDAVEELEERVKKLEDAGEMFIQSGSGGYIEITSNVDAPIVEVEDEKGEAEISSPETLTVEEIPEADNDLETDTDEPEGIEEFDVDEDE